MASSESGALSNQVVVLTGGAGLLGRQYAMALGAAGAHVVIADIDGPAARALADEVGAQTGVEALGVEVDVSGKPSVQRMVETAVGRFGRLDGLVNNAAIDPKFDREHSQAHTNAFEEYPLELWNQSLSVNLTGMFLCAQAVAPVMLAAGRGIIVNISSIYGVVGPDQRLYQAPAGSSTVFKPVDYSVTKSAAIGLTKYLATYWAGRNIRVNTLTLGGVFNDHDDGFVARYTSRVPMGRMASRDEYCGALLFLLSDASSYMTGANVVVDGGWTAW